MLHSNRIFFVVFVYNVFSTVCPLVFTSSLFIPCPCFFCCSLLLVVCWFKNIDLLQANVTIYPKFPHNHLPPFLRSIKNAFGDTLRYTQTYTPRQQTTHTHPQYKLPRGCVIKHVKLPSYNHIRRRHSNSSE